MPGSDRGFVLDVRTLTCPACGPHDRWACVHPVVRRPEDPVTVLGVELWCDCTASTVVYVDCGEDE